MMLMSSFSPVLDGHMKVLKYSEHNLPEILEAARRQQRESETAKVLGWGWWCGGGHRCGPVGG